MIVLRCMTKKYFHHEIYLATCNRWRTNFHHVCVINCEAWQFSFCDINKKSSITTFFLVKATKSSSEYWELPNSCPHQGNHDDAPYSFVGPITPKFWSYPRYCCNIPLSRGRIRLHLSAYLENRLPSKTSISLFCIFCPHSFALGKNFPIGHLSRNCSGPSTVNLRVLYRSASRKKVATY